MLITKTIEIDTGHRVPNHKSKCRNIHGHRYKIEVGVDDEIIQIKGVSDEGMVMDFNDLKEVMIKNISEPLDHGFIIYEKDILLKYFKKMIKTIGIKVVITDFIPTAENLAKHLYHKIKRELLKKGIRINHVKIWETPNSTAEYNNIDYFYENKKVKI
jgi:6-pyruvoyltetrahydropterin/6-carboxytetrahydropterin synthase